MDRTRHTDGDPSGSDQTESIDSGKSPHIADELLDRALLAGISDGNMEEARRRLLGPEGRGTEGRSAKLPGPNHEAIAEEEDEQSLGRLPVPDEEPEPLNPVPNDKLPGEARQSIALDRRLEDAEEPAGLQPRPTAPGRPDRVFNLLEQMRSAKPGQRIITQGGLHLRVEKVDEGEDRSRPASEGGDREASTEDEGRCRSDQ